MSITKLKSLFLILIFAFLFACSEGPGPLEGTWVMSGLVPVTVTFRADEEESLGLISKVKYEHKGNDVFVTYVDGLAKGTKMRVTMKSKNTAMTGMGKLTRVK